MVRRRRARLYPAQLCNKRRHPEPRTRTDKNHYTSIMKVIIIGGGIAGMTMGSFLRQKGIETVICEKQSDMGERGHAFLMHTEALSILEGLRTDGKTVLPLPGKAIERFTLRR